MDVPLLSDKLDATTARINDRLDMVLDEMSATRHESRVIFFGRARAGLSGPSGRALVGQRGNRASEKRLFVRFHRTPSLRPSS